MSVTSSPIPAAPSRELAHAGSAPARFWGRPLRLFARYQRARERPVGILMRMTWMHLNRSLGRQFVFRLHEHARMKIHYDYGSPVLAYYLGLYEHASMNFMLRYLRPGDVFADVGANLGVYSILAAGISGATVHAFEPVTSAREALVDNVRLNGIRDRVTVHPVGVGATAGMALITTDRHGANTIVRGGRESNFEEIEVVRLDSVMASTPPVLIKIDVEGFEEEVLRGAETILADPRVNALLVEAICRQAGDAERIVRIVRLLECMGFLAYCFDPHSGNLSRCIGTCEFVGPDDENVLFIRDAEEAMRRLNASTTER